jgi:hypothetical protein
LVFLMEPSKFFMPRGDLYYCQRTNCLDFRGNSLAVRHMIPVSQPGSESQRPDSLPAKIASVVALARISVGPSIPPSNRFLRRSTPFYACILFLASLVLFNIALLALRETHFFEKHLFDVRRISAVSQMAAITTQASPLSS